MKKTPSWDAYMEGDDDELEDSDDCWKTYKVSMLYHHTLHTCKPAVAFIRVWCFFSLSASNCVSFIRGQHLFKGGVYSRKYGLCRLPWYPQSGGVWLVITAHINLSNVTSSNTELLSAIKFTVHIQLVLVYTVQSAVHSNTPAYTCSQIP